MEFSKGDLVAGFGINTGEYLGKEILNAAGSTKIFHKIAESERGIVHYLPIKEDAPLRKLPARSTFKKYLCNLKTPDFIDIGELEGSRYRYFKSKLVNGDLKSTLEVFHDLNIFNRRKKLTVSEKKLFNSLKEKITTELSAVLGIDSTAAETLVSEIGYAA